MALLLLLWDRMRLSAHILQQTWRISNLENENHKLVEDMGKLANADEDDRPSMFARIKAQYLKAREDRKAKKGHRAAAKAAQEAGAPADSAPSDSSFEQENPQQR